MKILFLSFYYSPDLCAGSFRSEALVRAMRKLSPESEIEVVTTLPNRYSSFSVDAPEFEQEKNLKINRIKLPSHKSGMIDQSKAFYQYAKRTREIAKNGKYDLVYATSSRLMTAVLGALIAKNKKLPLYLDIRDIFVDTIKDVLPKHLAVTAKPFFAYLERWAIKRATKVNLVSRGFEHYFKEGYPKQRFSFFTNGIDDEFLKEMDEQGVNEKTGDVLSVLYAGNIGEGQGLHEILPELGKRTAGKLEFKIFGDGGRKDKLASELLNKKVENVHIYAPISRKELIKEYQKANILFLHLNNYEAFKKVLPSKIFEYAAIGKPIWAGVPGFSAEFLRSEVENVAVFDPCDAISAENSLKKLKLDMRQRLVFMEKYKRSSISKEMAKDILTLVGPS